MKKNYVLMAILASFLQYVNAQQADSLSIMDSIPKVAVEPIEPNTKPDNEVIIVGYGTQKKKHLTSAVSTIRSDAFDNRPIYNVGQALQGNATGVVATQVSGKPGSSLDIKIRGNNSISSSVSPLYVVDGIQTTDINGINSADIIDITILKDATATAIYGVNGSSGVVIITTKKGKSTGGQLNFDAYWGISKISNTIDILNLEQYKDYLADLDQNTGSSYLATANLSKYEGINTNWSDEVFQSGFDQNYNLGYSFGTDNVKAYTSLGYQIIDGVINPSKFKRLSTKINLDAHLLKNLKFSTSLNYFNTKLSNTSDNLSVARGGVVLAALNTPAFLPIYGEQLGAGRNPDADGEKDGQFASNPYQSSWENPVAYQSSFDETETNRFMSNFSLEYKPIKDLTIKPSLSYDYSSATNEKFIDGYRTSYGRQNEGIGSISNDKYRKIVFETTASYDINTDKQDVNFLIGGSAQRERSKYHNYGGDHFPEGITAFDYDLATQQQESLNEEERRFLSGFGRVSYTFNDKYTLVGVFRADGASSLAPGNKWGFFPGISASWNIGRENFLKNNRSITELKLRGGWGQTGNISGIPYYSHFALNRLSELGTAGVWSPIQNESSDLTWETTTDQNIGLDVGLFNNRIKFSADYFMRTTKDLIIDVIFPNISIPYYKNAGEMENNGFEFSLNTINVNSENFKWNTNFNISFLDNKITNIDYVPFKDRAYIETVGANLVRQAEGQTLGVFYGYKVDQVNPETGVLEYQDINNDGMINSLDRTYIGNPNPDFTFGFTNNFSYKNLYLDCLITGTQGNEVYNASRFDTELMKDFKNQSTAVLNRWQNVGDITDVPKAGDVNALQVSDRFVEDGSFIKIKAVTIGYNFKQPFKGLDKLNIYVTGQNLYTFTDYKGFDPEVNAFSGSTGVFGVDYGTYPQVRTFIFGIKANFK